MRRIVLALIVVLVVTALPVAAADNGLYLGIGLGRSNLDPGKFFPSIGDISTEQHNSAYKLFGGYRFLDYLAVEGGYIDLGSPQVLEAAVLPHPKTLETKVNGWGAFAVGLLPVRKVDFLAKIGMISWGADVTVIQDAAPIVDESYSGSDIAYGIGMNAKLGKLVTLRGDMERYELGDYDTVTSYMIVVIFTL